MGSFQNLNKTILESTLFGRGQLIRHLEKEVLPTCDSLLDLGCGPRSPISRFSAKIPHSVGVDIFEEAILSSQKAGIHKAYRQIDICFVADVFPPKSFDVVIALDLIEHLHRVDGLRLIDSMEKIARKKIVIFTPNGYVPQDDLNHNVWQRHLSGWSYNEMLDLGFKITGISGWKSLRGRHGEIAHRPKIFWFLISRLSQFYTENHPSKSFALLCVKNV